MCAETYKYPSSIHEESLGMPKDLKVFQEFAENGELYEYIQESLELGTGSGGRRRAKDGMFEIFFSGRKNPSRAKKRVRELFPALVFVIDAFKRAYEDDAFSVFLQTEESRIFIDGILPKLQNAGYQILTKHDSILCKSSDVEGVEKIMREVLDEELGGYELRAE
jgi:hypothetical protein